MLWEAKSARDETPGCRGLSASPEPTASEYRSVPSHAERRPPTGVRIPPRSESNVLMLAWHNNFSNDADRGYVSNAFKCGQAELWFWLFPLSAIHRIHERAVMLSDSLGLDVQSLQSLSMDKCSRTRVPTSPRDTVHTQADLLPDCRKPIQQQYDEDNRRQHINWQV